MNKLKGGNGTAANLEDEMLKEVSRAIVLGRLEAAASIQPDTDRRRVALVILGGHTHAVGQHRHTRVGDVHQRLRVVVAQTCAQGEQTRRKETKKANARPVKEAWPRAPASWQIGKKKRQPGQKLPLEKNAPADAPPGGAARSWFTIGDENTHAAHTRRKKAKGSETNRNGLRSSAPRSRALILFRGGRHVIAVV